jgi:molecular chaperone HscB
VSNYFKKFNLPIRFQINLQELEANYLKLQQQFHPDFALDKTGAEINSILINQAYQILKNPLKRAIYLLQLQGIDIDNDECVVKPSQENLMLVMEIREEIMESSDNKNRIDEIKQKIKKIISDEMSRINGLLVGENWLEASQKLIKLKYLDKIISDLKINKHK